MRGVGSFSPSEEVRSDHIGRPMFATNSAGVKTWTAADRPFGGVRVTTGTPPTARFPGQWLQFGEPDQTSLRGSNVPANGLHQNWMRDYDPTTGRYMQADPLGLVDGTSVNGYARQNLGRYTDPTGEFVPQAIVACIVNPWCRAAVGAAAGWVYGYFVDEDGCYSWGEQAYCTGLGASTTWALGKGAAPLFQPTSRLFRPGSWFNRGQHFRLGWGRAPGSRQVFRAAGGVPKTPNHWHIDLYFP